MWNVPSRTITNILFLLLYCLYSCQWTIGTLPCVPPHTIKWFHHYLYFLNDTNRGTTVYFFKFKLDSVIVCVSFLMEVLATFLQPGPFLIFLHKRIWEELFLSAAHFLFTLWTGIVLYICVHFISTSCGFLSRTLILEENDLYFILIKSICNIVCIM